MLNVVEKKEQCLLMNVMHYHQAHYKYLTSFPKDYREGICDLSTFIGMVKERQESMPKHFLM